MVDKFARGLILSKQYENANIKDDIYYRENGIDRTYPVQISNGIITLSENFSHIFQLNTLIKNLFYNKTVERLMFCTSSRQFSSIGFHNEEIKLASFLASINEVPILYVEGIYDSEIARKLNITEEEYRSILIFLPKDFSGLTDKQLTYLTGIAKMLKEQKVTHFEIAMVGKKMDETKFLNSVDAYMTIAKIQDVLEERQNRVKTL